MVAPLLFVMMGNFRTALPIRTLASTTLCVLAGLLLRHIMYVYGTYQSE